MSKREIYLDCNATTPIEPEVLDILIRYTKDLYGNAGSRTHSYGVEAKKAVDKAREQIASVVDCSDDEVFFTSGATESDNISILGLADYGVSSNKKHIITTNIEHKAVLEPLKYLATKGFNIEYLHANKNGRISPSELKKKLRSDTLLVSIMHVNNETGVIQPLKEVCDILEESEAYLHTDAAQGFCKELNLLRNKRIDFISVSGHKIYAPKGIGALIMRKRSYRRAPITPLFFGGGQERGVRPGTQPVSLIAALGLASELLVKNHKRHNIFNEQEKEKAIERLTSIGGIVIGDQTHCVNTTLSIGFRGIDSEAIILALKGIAAISNGSACTSSSYKPSHVLQGMGLDDELIRGTIRLSWCHLTESLDWDAIKNGINAKLK